MLSLRYTVPTIAAVAALLPSTLTAGSPGEDLEQLDRNTYSEMVQDAEHQIVVVSLVDQDVQAGQHDRAINYQQAWQDQDLSNDVQQPVTTVVFYDPNGDTAKRTEAMKSFEQSGFEDVEYYFISDRSVLTASDQAHNKRFMQLGKQAEKIDQATFREMLQENEGEVAVVSLTDDQAVRGQRGWSQDKLQTGDKKLKDHDRADLKAQPGSKMPADERAARNAGNQGAATTKDGEETMPASKNPKSAKTKATDRQQAVKASDQENPGVDGVRTGARQGAPISYRHAWEDQDMRNDLDEEISSVVFIDSADNPAKRGEAIHALQRSGFDDVDYYYLPATEQRKDQQDVDVDIEADEVEIEE